jgi:hypothetical protein
VAKDRLSKVDLDEIRKRVEFQNFFKFATTAISFYNDMWKTQKVAEKGLDTNANYEINLETGLIKVVETPKELEIKEDGTK